MLTLLQDSESDGSVRRLSQVSLDIFLIRIISPNITNANTQHANIARIVTEKDLGSLQTCGVKRIADALDTDLEKWIPGDAQDLQSRHLASQISQTESAPKTFFQCLLKACNNYMIVHLLVSLVLSLTYRIKREGVQRQVDMKGSLFLFPS